MKKGFLLGSPDLKHSLSANHRVIPIGVQNSFPPDIPRMGDIAEGAPLASLFQWQHLFLLSSPLWVDQMLGGNNVREA